MMNLFRRKRDDTPAPDIAPVELNEASAADRTSYEAWTPEGAPPVEAGPAGPIAEAPPAEAGEADTKTDSTDTAPATEPAPEGEPLGMEAQVVEALKKVYDPEIPVSIYELGLIYGIDAADDGEIAVTMTLTTPGCPVAEQMPGMVEHAVLEFVPEAREVDVEIVWDPPWRPDMMSDAAKLELGFY